MRWYSVKNWVFVACLSLCVSGTAGQNLTIPGTWQNPTSDSGRTSREALAYEAALPLADINTLGATGLSQLQDITSLYALLALQDYYSGNNSWHTQGTDGVQAYIDKFGYFAAGKQQLYSDAIYWGLALFYSYRTYKDPVLMNLALDAWDQTYTGALITPNEAVTGIGAGRNVSFLPPANCTGGTIAGGVFRSKDIQNSTYASMEAIGPFMTLSAYLYEETNNVTYQQTAQLSLDFVLNHLWNGSIVFDGVTLDSCQYTPKPFTINQAWFIEGLSVWANVTKNDTLTALLPNVVSNITKFPSWSLPDGVVFDHDPETNSFDQILKGIYIRGLAEARMRNPGTELAEYIEAYITVQYNSLLNNARAPAPNDSFYSVSWTGPASSSFDAGGNVAALDVLNAAFSLVAPSTPVNSSTGTPTSGSQPQTTLRKSSKTGTIVGGVLGCVAATTAVLAIILFIHRRKRTSDNAVQPFAPAGAYTPTTSTSSKFRGSVASRPVTLSMPVQGTTRGQVLDQEPIDVSELPSLMQRLNNFLQSRQGELPPRYVE